MKVAITGHRPGQIVGQEQGIKEWVKDYLRKVECKEK